MIIQPVAYTSVGNVTLRYPFETIAMELMAGCCAATKVEKLPEPLNSEMVIVEEVSKVNLSSWMVEVESGVYTVPT